MTNPTSDDSHNDETKARRALSRLAAQARTEPTRDVGSNVVATQQTVGAASGSRFDGRRLAVAAAITALIIGGGFAVRQRGARPASSAAPEVVDPPETGAATASGALALGAGFSPSPVWPDGRPAEPPTVQRQYALDAASPETGPYLIVEPQPSSDISFRLNWVPPTDSADETDLADDSPETAFDQVSLQLASGERCGTGVQAEMTGVGSVADPVGESAGSSSVPDENQPDENQLVDTSSGCLVSAREISGELVLAVGVGLTPAQIHDAAAHLVAADDGFGYQVEPAGLPDGFSEIAAVVTGDAVVPASAWTSADWSSFVWQPADSDAGRANPVLDRADIEAASIGVVADGGSGLEGQRLLFAQVQDATVGGDTAVVQVSRPDQVAVVWRHDGSLYRYHEVGPGADPVATVDRANRLLPFILDPDVAGTDATTTEPTPTTATPTTIPECDGVVSTVAPPSVPPTLACEVADAFGVEGTAPSTITPSSSVIDETTTTATTWPETTSTTSPETTTTTTYPGPDDEWSTTVPNPGPGTPTTEPYPGPGEDWPTTTTYPGQGDHSDEDYPTTTTYPGQGEPWATTTYPGYPDPPTTQP